MPVSWRQARAPFRIENARIVPRPFATYAKPSETTAGKLDQVAVRERPDDPERRTQARARVHAAVRRVGAVHRPLQARLVDAENEARPSPEVHVRRCRRVPGRRHTHEDRPRGHVDGRDPAAVPTQPRAADPDRRSGHALLQVAVQHDDSHPGSLRALRRWRRRRTPRLFLGACAVSEHAAAGNRSADYEERECCDQDSARSAASGAERSEGDASRVATRPEGPAPSLSAAVPRIG